MSSTNINLHCKNTIVDQILEQGQRLRNSMVESILNNDPLNIQVINYRHESTCNNNINELDKPLSPQEKQLFIAYVRGDRMTKSEELQALDTFRKMSPADISEITDRTCLSYKATCNCDTCKAYYSENYTETFKVPLLNLKIIDEKMNYLEATPITNFLKYVDSLRVSIHNLVFNCEGLKKINCKNNLFKLPPSYTHSYFVEYAIPDVIIPKNNKIKAKVDTGMSNNKIRFCSKSTHNEGLFI